MRPTAVFADFAAAATAPLPLSAMEPTSTTSVAMSTATPAAASPPQQQQQYLGGPLSAGDSPLNLEPLPSSTVNATPESVVQVQPLTTFMEERRRSGSGSGRALFSRTSGVKSAATPICVDDDGDCGGDMRKRRNRSLVDAQEEYLDEDEQNQVILELAKDADRFATLNRLLLLVLVLLAGYFSWVSWYAHVASLALFGVAVCIALKFVSLPSCTAYVRTSCLADMANASKRVAPMGGEGGPATAQGPEISPVSASRIARAPPPPAHSRTVLAVVMTVSKFVLDDWSRALTLFVCVPLCLVEILLWASGPPTLNPLYPIGVVVAPLAVAYEWYGERVVTQNKAEVANMAKLKYDFKKA